MRKLISLTLLSCLCAALTGCARGKESQEKAEAPLHIVVATDLHYLSPKLTDYGTGFMRMLENGDGKVTQYSPEIVDSFLMEVSKLHPAALILSGDLAFNGERESHEELAGRLVQLQEEGIPVLVIPGNHDLNNPFAASFEGETVTRTSPVSGEEFADIYGNSGYGVAASKDEESLSFLYQLTEKVWLLLLDSNTRESPGRLREGTLLWLEEQLEKAKESGASVITVTHQNVLIQNSLLSQGFVMGNHEETAELLHQYGVRLNLSGHVHIQHIAEENGLYDVATGALSVSPNQYGLIEIDTQGKISYGTKTVAMAKQVATAESEEEKAGIDVIAREFFDNCTRRKMEKELAPFDAPPEEKERMVELAVMMNRDYFAGTMKKNEEIRKMDAWKLWEEKGENLFFKRYMDSMMEDEGREGNRLVIEPWSVEE